MKPGMIGFAAQMRTRLAARGLHGTSLRDPAGIDIEGILKDVEEVEKLWEMVEAVLADAEEREIREQSVRVWLHQLRDLCYDMEDVPDLFEYQLTASEVETAGTSNQVPPLENPSFWNDIQDRVSKIKHRFKNIVENKEGLQLKEAVVVGSISDKVNGSITSRATTGSYPVGKLLGRNGEFAELSLLLKAEGGDNRNNVVVIAIVGRDSVGKTFLAQHIFQDLDDPVHFDITGWVSVSQDFDLVGITKDVLEAFTDEDGGNCKQLHILQKRIRKFIQGKKFFLVMDDVPNLQVDQWESFFSVFVNKSGARKGSKVVITSRGDRVAVRAAHHVYMGSLTEEDGWSLLRYHASANPKAELPRELETIGREIVRKCECFPLAIKQHGQLLCRTGDNEDAWRCNLEAKHLRDIRVCYYGFVPANKIFASKKHTFWGYSVSETSNTLEVCEVNALRFLCLCNTHIRNLDDCLSESKLLRTLYLSGYEITRVPTCLCKLYNLRDLNLSYIMISKSYPISLATLRT